MPYTPVELRHVRIGRRLLGYERDAVDELLTEVADSFEAVWRERGELADRLEALERELAGLRERERLLTETLVAAERTAAEVREQAKREAERIVAEAHGEARSIVRAAQGERQRLFAETRRIEALLRAALGMVEEGTGGAASGEQAPGWPQREETREFERPAAPEALAAPEEFEDLSSPPGAPPQLRTVSGGLDRAQ